MRLFALVVIFLSSNAWSMVHEINGPAARDVIAVIQDLKNERRCEGQSCSLQLREIECTAFKRSGVRAIGCALEIGKSSSNFLSLELRDQEAEKLWSTILSAGIKENCDANACDLPVHSIDCTISNANRALRDYSCRFE